MENHDIKKLQIEDHKTTKITFNKGGIWHDIPFPAEDSLGKPIICANCSLHLHSYSHDHLFSPILSKKSALGIILATGNIGKYLSLVTDRINNYISADGGYSWKEIAKGSHIFEVADHGGLIIIARDYKATNGIIFSWY